MFLGVFAARQLNLKLGESVTVRGAKLPVLGTLGETGGLDDVALFLALPVALRFEGDMAQMT